MSLILSFLSNLMGTIISLGIALGFYFYLEQDPLAFLVMIPIGVFWIRWIVWLKQLEKEVDRDNKLLQDKKQNPTLPKESKE